MLSNFFANLHAHQSCQNLVQLQKDILGSSFTKSVKQLCLLKNLKNVIELDPFLRQKNRYSKHVMVSGFISKIGKSLVLFAKEGTPVNRDYYLQILNKHLYLVNESSLFKKTGLIATLQILLPFLVPIYFKEFVNSRFIFSLHEIYKKSSKLFLTKLSFVTLS